MLFRRKKKINLDTNARIDAANLKVNSAFIMFQQAHDALDEANTHLEETLVESGKKVNSLQGQLDNEYAALQRAADQKLVNEKLKEQLKPFIL